MVATNDDMKSRISFLSNFAVTAYDASVHRHEHLFMVYKSAF